MGSTIKKLPFLLTGHALNLACVDKGLPTYPLGRVGRVVLLRELSWLDTHLSNYL